MEEVKTVETVVEPVKVAPTVETNVEVPNVPSKNDILRELSKEYGVSLFDAEGLKQFKEFTESQKSELQKAQEKLDAYETEKQSWESKQREYESKLKASELGINQDSLEDALKLAGNDPSKLAEVVKKYPMFQSKQGIKIGVTKPNDDNTPNGLTEKEEYMAKNPQLYKNYIKK